MTDRSDAPRFSFRALALMRHPDTGRVLVNPVVLDHLCERARVPIGPLLADEDALVWQVLFWYRCSKQSTGLVDEQAEELLASFKGPPIPNPVDVLPSARC